MDRWTGEQEKDDRDAEGNNEAMREGGTEVNAGKLGSFARDRTFCFVSWRADGLCSSRHKNS